MLCWQLISSTLTSPSAAATASTTSAAHYDNNYYTNECICALAAALDVHVLLPFIARECVLIGYFDAKVGSVGILAKLVSGVNQKYEFISNAGVDYIERYIKYSTDL